MSMARMSQSSEEQGRTFKTSDFLSEPFDLPSLLDTALTRYYSSVFGGSRVLPPSSPPPPPPSAIPSPEGEQKEKADEGVPLPDPESLQKLDAALRSLNSELQHMNDEGVADSMTSAQHLLETFPVMTEDVFRAVQEVEGCRGSLSELLSTKTSIDASTEGQPPCPQQQTGLFTHLLELDASHRRLTHARKLYNEIHQWDVRLQELDALLASGNLQSVSNHIRSLRSTAEVLQSVDTTSSRPQIIDRYEEKYQVALRASLDRALMKYSVEDVHSCYQLYRKGIMQHHISGTRAEAGSGGGKETLNDGKRTEAISKAVEGTEIFLTDVCNSITQRCQQLWQSLWAKAISKPHTQNPDAGLPREFERDSEGIGGKGSDGIDGITEAAAVEAFFEECSRLVEKYFDILRIVVLGQDETGDTEAREGPPPLMSSDDGQAGDPSGFSKPALPSDSDEEGDGNLLDDFGEGSRGDGTQKVSTNRTGVDQHVDTGKVADEEAKILLRLLRGCVGIPVADVSVLCKDLIAVVDVSLREGGEKNGPPDAGQSALSGSFQKKKGQACARALQLLQAYSHACHLVLSCPPIAHNEKTLWPAFARSSDDPPRSIMLPLTLMQALTLLLMSCLKDSVAKLGMIITSTWSANPNKAVQEAEGQSQKALRRLIDSGLRLEDDAVAAIAPVWLKEIDIIAAEYAEKWKDVSKALASMVDQRLKHLIGRMSSGGEMKASSFSPDGELLNLTMTWSARVYSFRSTLAGSFLRDSLQKAKNLYSAPHKLNAVQRMFTRDLLKSCRSLSRYEDIEKILRVLEGKASEMQPDELAPLLAPRLYLTANELVEHCTSVFAKTCAYPLHAVFKLYDSQYFFAEEGAIEDAMVSCTCTPIMQAAGDYLFSLLPYFDSFAQNATENSDALVALWLPAVLEATAHPIAERVEQMQRVSPRGLLHLLNDLRYILSMLLQMGGGTTSGSSTQSSLKKWSEALEFLVDQQRSSAEHLVPQERHSVDLDRVAILKAKVHSFQNASNR